MALGTGAEAVACRGRALPTKFGPRDFECWWGGGRNLPAVLGSPELSFRLYTLCCSKQLPADSVSGRRMKTSAYAGFSLLSAKFPFLMTLRAAAGSHPRLPLYPSCL